MVRVIAPDYRRASITRLPNYPIYNRPVIPAVILAAGLSTRMGRPKPLLPLSGGETFVTRIVRSFLESGVDDVVVVLGHEADAVAAKLIESGVAARFVINEAYQTGQLSSVLRGLNAIDRPGVRAMLLTLVDVPLVVTRHDSRCGRSLQGDQRANRASRAWRRARPSRADRSFAVLVAADCGS